jgi:sulfate adenylyltransferase subunit 2
MTHNICAVASHLRALEAESIFILREVIALRERPLLLYSMGKDSAVLLHLAYKAFAPGPVPCPLLHIDTTWKFAEMITFRDEYVRKTLGLDVIVHTNQDALAQGVSPFTHGSRIYTDLMKTEALRQALDAYRCDAAIGGARRDEERSRAKERIVSVRDRHHHWDPRRQRPEVWNLFNTELGPGESLRVFPLSDWTELDVWRYIHHEQIPVVPLYFAKPRPVVRRDGVLIMVDDDRMVLREGETPEWKRVRFRTLGCYPLTGAMESDADSVPALIDELRRSRFTERQGRVIDVDQSSSMETKKKDGYF